jgi:hypothetical protein
MCLKANLCASPMEGFAYIPQAAVRLASRTLRIPLARMRALSVKIKMPAYAGTCILAEGGSQIIS